MRSFSNTALACLLLSLFCAGCAKSPEDFRRQEAETLQTSIRAALASGKSAFLCRAPRRALWVQMNAPADTQAGGVEFFTLRPEMPRLNGYSVVVVEPGTYAFAGGSFTGEKDSDPRIANLPSSVENKRSRKNAPLLGFVQQGQVSQTQVLKQNTSNPTYDTYLNMISVSVGQAYSNYGSSHGSRLIPQSWLGMGMEYAPSYAPSAPLRVESRVISEQRTYMFSLPNSGNTKRNSTLEPLVASIAVAPGEAVVLDNIFITSLQADFTQCPPGGTPCRAEAVSLAVEKHTPSGSQALPQLGVPIVEDRRITRGPWLTGQDMGKGIARNTTFATDRELFNLSLGQ